MSHLLDYSIAFKKPFSDSKKLMIGLAISIFSTAIVMVGKFGGPTLVALLTLVGLLIGLFISGYYFRIANLTLKKNNNLPEWKDWKDLFIKGLFITVIGFIYALPVLLLGLIFGGVAMFTLNKTDPLAAANNMVVVFGIIVLLVIFMAYLVPSAILGFIKRKKFGAAFDFKEVFKKAFVKRYAIAWLVSFAYALFLSFILALIPYVGSGIASFITGVTSMTLLAEAYRQ